MNSQLWGCNPFLENPRTEPDPVATARGEVTVLRNLDLPFPALPTWWLIQKQSKKIESLSFYKLKCFQILPTEFCEKKKKTCISCIQIFTVFTLELSGFVLGDVGHALGDCRVPACSSASLWQCVSPFLVALKALSACVNKLCFLFFFNKICLQSVANSIWLLLCKYAYFIIICDYTYVYHKIKALKLGRAVGTAA